MLVRISPSALLFVALLPMSALGGDADPLGAVGSWSVVSTFSRSTCAKPNDVGGTDAYSWLVSADASGRYDVVVQGTTSFPHLAGHASAEGLHLVGIAGDGKVGPGDLIATSPGDLASDPSYTYRVGTSEFDLVEKDGRLVGTRIVMLVEPVFATVAGKPPNVYTACRIEYAVTAKRA